MKSASRTLAKERIAYYEAKSKLDLNNPETANELKKLLMRRAMFTIPMIITLQQSGGSVQNLYQRGMLTDDVFNNVLHSPNNIL